MASYNLAKELRAIKLHLLLRGRIIWEGSTSLAEVEYLASLAARNGIRKIAEIGFNCGFSSYAFLRANPSAEVVSFDLGEHGYAHVSKRYIDRAFPGRHRIFWGDSKQTVVAFSKAHPNERFDLLFIDGGHDYETAKTDIRNMKELAAPGALVVIDDLTPWLAWGKGPTQAWSEAIREGMIVQEEQYLDGKRVDRIAPPGKRSWALGRYQ